MTELDRLPPDQRAVLSLVLDRGKSYGEVAEMLAIPERAVRDRAHAALDALANEREREGDARASAPASPVRASTVHAGASPEGAPQTGTSQAGKSRAEALAAASAASPPPPRRRDPGGASGPLSTPSSRRAGALLLGAIVVVVVVAVILVSSGGGKGSTPSATTSSSAATSTTAAGKPTLNKTIALTASEPSLKASGTAYVLSQNGRSAFYITAQGLPPSSGFFYAVWLYNSPSSSAPLGRASNVGSDGRLQGGNPLPTNANLYHQLVVTRETSTHPTHPGPIVLRGTFALH
jgi:hypothetical protein